jgi:beta-phosphoglucomutase-like phosphatase (HAD superfamily)
MQNIKALLLEPVGCLAEFPSAPFHEIAVRFFGRKGKASPSASRTYWHLLNLMEAAPLDAEQRAIAETMELEAVAQATLYEDVCPMLGELKSMGVSVSIATSLSRAAVREFINRNSLGDLLMGTCSRDDVGGVKSAPLVHALGSNPPEQAIFLADTVEGIKAARTAGVLPILMMNDPDEAQRLETHKPAGGVVSLHEIPDFIRLVAAQNQRG